MEIEEILYAFVRDEAVNGTRWSADDVFRILGELVQEFDPKNRELLAKRASLQTNIDDYYIEKRKAGWQPTAESAAQDATEFGRFLGEISYLNPETSGSFSMTTPQLDSEMDQNGPELVTPVTSASMAVGGANARWGSLYDAYFLSDVQPEIDKEKNREMFEEQVEVMRRLWTRDLVTYKGRWHRITDAGLNPLPIQRPIPIWFGGMADQVLKRTAHFGDGWFPQFQPDSEGQERIDEMRECARVAGRDPGKIGIEGRVGLATDKQEDWEKLAAAWDEVGGTHLSVNTMRAGLKGPDQHIEAIKRFKETVSG